MASGKKLFSKKQVRAVTDPRSWERGVGYFRNGNVLACFEDGATVAAKVAGTRPYRVTLSVEDGALRGVCTCPMGDDDVFCKHCVAAGLTYLANTSVEGKKDGGKPLTLDDLRRYLSKQDTATLVEMIMNQVLDNDSLREKLLVRAALHRPEGINVATLRQAIDAATDFDFVDYESSYSVGRSIEIALEGLDELLTTGYAAEVIELAEYAVECVEEVMCNSDDSNGCIGSNLDHLRELHRKACTAARPDPEALARRLFDWQLTSQFSTFDGAPEDYADVLGDKGIAAYRKLAEAEWEKVPHIGPDQKEHTHGGHRYKMTRVMESLARLDGDIEALVAVKSRNLSHAYSYYEIAEIYRQARKFKKALEWAERGVKAFPRQTDSRLRQLLANEYHRRKRHEEAVGLMWAEFVDSPQLAQYQGLSQSAQKAGRWPEWRETAIAYLREKLARPNADDKKNAWVRRPEHSSTLVRIFLWEKDVDAAWSQAQDGNCSQELWMQLATLREKDHPADAVSAYKGMIEPIIQRKNNYAYAEAVDLIRKVGRLMAGMGRNTEFGEYVLAVSKAHRPKRNLMAMLREAKLIST